MTGTLATTWSRDGALARARDGRERAVADLVELLRIPSCSALPEHAVDVRSAAAWIAARLEALGMAVEVAEGDPHPVVHGEWLGRPGAPTLAIYSHFDVQPPAPLAAWTTPPFEPDVRDGAIYARGARDDKGQLVAGLAALEHAFAAGGPPLNVRVLYEGEEEIAGTSLGAFLRTNAERLQTDYALIVDGQFVAPGVPGILTVLRGVLIVEMELSGPATDLHSGLFGGVAPNPLNALAHVVAGLKDRDGRITIPGFYDGIVPPGEAESSTWASVPIDEATLLRDIGSGVLAGEPGYTPLERLWARPTLDVHGYVGGHQGPGSKTVIPARAVAKVSMRLVPGQDVDAVLAALERRVEELLSPGISATITELGRSRPNVFGVDHPGIEAMRRALRAAFGAESVLARLGGSIPVTADFQDVLDPGMIVLGFGLPDDGNHAPDEHFSLAQFHGATEAMLHLMDELPRLHGGAG